MYLFFVRMYTCMCMFTVLYLSVMLLPVYMYGGLWSEMALKLEPNWKTIGKLGTSTYRLD